MDSGTVAFARLPANGWWPTCWRASRCRGLIPSVIAYCGLIGVPPAIWAYAALVPLVVYPLIAVRGSDWSARTSPFHCSCERRRTFGRRDPRALWRGRHGCLAKRSGCWLLGARARIGAAADFSFQPSPRGLHDRPAADSDASQSANSRGPLEHNDSFRAELNLGGNTARSPSAHLMFGLGLLAALLALRRFRTQVPLR